MASVRRLKPSDPKSPWIVEYTDGAGKRHRKTPGSGLKKDADALARKIEREMDDGVHTVANQSIGATKAIDLWLQSLEARVRAQDMTKSTFSHYMTLSKRLKRNLGKVLLSEIGRVTLQKLADDLVGAEYAPASVRHSFDALFGVFDFAVGEKYLVRNPMRDFTVKLPPRKKAVTVASKADLRKLLWAADQTFHKENALTRRSRRAVLYLALFTGMRRGEICGLKWDAVDFERKTIWVRHSFSFKADGLKGPKTASGVRSVEMVPQVEEVLLEIGGERGPEEFVLQGRDGRKLLPIDISHTIWKGLCKKAGLLTADGLPKHTLHGMRHAAASLLIEQGLSPLHVKEALGHANVTTTLSIYSHLFPEDKAIGKAAREIAGAFQTRRERDMTA